MPGLQALESLLHRKAADLRRGILAFLLEQDDPATLESAQRLLKTSKAPQRAAGLELLVQLQQAAVLVADVDGRRCQRGGDGGQDGGEGGAAFGSGGSHQCGA